MSKKMVSLLGLIVIEQVIKLYIYYYRMNEQFEIIGEKVAFRPYLNIDQLSIFNHELDMKLGVVTLIIINIIGIIILSVVYFNMKYRQKEYTNCFFELMFLFLVAGSICSLIDKILYGGSIDYLVLSKHIYDLKDIYLGVGVGFNSLYILTYIYKDRNVFIRKRY